MKEQQPNTLKDALKGLPSYAPGDSVWAKLSNELDRVQEEEPLQAAIVQLPNYQPSPKVWSLIEKQLPGKVVSMPAWRWAVAAAVVIGLFSVTQWWFSSAPAKVQVVYGETEATVIPANFNDKADESDFKLIVGLYQDSQTAKQNPEYTRLIESLEDLNLAKEEIEFMLERYGKDVSLVRQLRDIELERTAVIKKMAALI